MPQTAFPEEVENELRQAQDSMNEGNDGKARVCARRAVAKAFLMSRFSRGVERSVSAMDSLRLIAGSEEMPEQIRDAARRLSVSVTENIPMSQRPVDDAILIVKLLLDI